MKKTSVAVLAAVAGLLVSAASPVMAQDDVNIGITVVPNRSNSAYPGQAAYGGPIYNAADVESPYGDPGYDAPRYGYGGYNGYDSYGSSGYGYVNQGYSYGYDAPRYSGYDRPPAYVGTRYNYNNRPTYINQQRNYYGYRARRASNCYWQRQRAYDGYGWGSRPVRVCY